MAFLNRNKGIFLFVVLLSGCATSSFEVVKKGDLLVELKVTPDRILLECEPLAGHEVEDAHGFLMYILDDKKTVLTVAQFNILAKEDCFEGLQSIEKVLRTGRTIYVGGMGDLTKPKVESDSKYAFPGLGAFPSNGKTVKFMVIANERGLCYDAHNGDKGPCPRDPFSFKISK